VNIDGIVDYAMAEGSLENAMWVGSNLTLTEKTVAAAIQKR
jgi:hypothetical protein